MEQAQYNSLFSFIWNIANDVLVNAFNKGDYKKVILPMLVLRRIDVLLEKTKDEVLSMRERLRQSGINDPAPLLCQVSGHPFYNTSRFTMKTLRAETDPQRLRLNFIDYLNGYSRDVLDIIDKLRLRQVVDNLTETGRLGSIIEKFTSDRINLSSEPVVDQEGRTLHPALDNHTVGTMFEELLRRFNEENNVTEAGEHFTPRDYVKLLADLAVLPVADKITDTTYSVYDGACGTGGILTIAQERIAEIARQRGKQVKIDIYGQELQAETYATCKADLMIAGHVRAFQYPYGDQDREYIAFGSTISQDGHRDERFDFCISNPPFGTPWKEDLKRFGLGEKEKARLGDPRFREAGAASYLKGPVSFLPDIGDCQMLFLANNLSRMVDDTALGTRIVEVHNGSSLFTGAAGSGSSNLRRHIIERDLLEAVIAMPENIFFNTGIGTYIWIVTNRKEPRRQGKVQLIDATRLKTPLRKNLGLKNCEVDQESRAEILRLLTDFRETEQSRIFPNREFGYWSVTVERPLRLLYTLPPDGWQPAAKKPADAELLQRCLRVWRELHEGGEALSDAQFFRMLRAGGVRVAAGKVALLRKTFGSRSPEAPVCRQKPADESSPLVPDPELRDTEQVPLLYPGGVEAFLRDEVLPYAPDAYYDPEGVCVGYELSFTKYFYRPAELRPIEDIANDIREVEQGLRGRLEDILNI
ncbi:MAG: type I restriction-modification system subunit M [Prevotellaceae bacterium]|nr:type I restriction-modification system subunit M [Prevotellaceae bacterium]